MLVATPLTNDLVKVPVRGCVVVGFHEDGHRSHLVVDTGFGGADGVKVVELDLSIVSFSFLGVLGGCVEVDVTEKPPLGKALAVINPSEPAWFARFGAHDPVLVVPIELDGLRDAQGVSFDGKGIGVFQLL